MLKTIISSQEFYDTIAEDYNDFLETDENRKIRKIVCEALTSRVSQGIVVDFGGGTGLDLEWIASYNRYKVFFLEPSEKMRHMAHQKAKSLRMSNINFVEQNLELKKWNKKNLPVPEQANALLANFAVFNCIENLNTLFEKLALIVKPGGLVFATVIDSGFIPTIKHYSIWTGIKSLIKKVIVSSDYRSKGHLTYLHTLKDYRLQSSKYFHFLDYKNLGLANFRLLILRRI